MRLYLPGRERIFIQRTLIALLMALLCGCAASGPAQAPAALEAPETPEAPEAPAAPETALSHPDALMEAPDKAESDALMEAPDKGEASALRDEPDSTASAPSAPSAPSDEDRAPLKVEAVTEGMYTKLSAGENVRLLIVGDSIGAGSGVKDEDNWVSRLGRWIEVNYGTGCEITNVSMGGNSSFAGYARVKTLPEEPVYDAAVVCYGQNDGTKVFPGEYEALIRALKKKYGGCDIICVLESSQKKYTKKMLAIREISAYYGLQEADAIAAFHNSPSDYDELTLDGKHPNEKGHELYFAALREIVEESVKQKKAGTEPETEADTTPGQDTITLPSPLNSAAAEYESFLWLPSREWNRTDENAWEIAVGDAEDGAGSANEDSESGTGARKEPREEMQEEIQEDTRRTESTEDTEYTGCTEYTGRLGFDQIYAPGGGWVDIYLDGIKEGRCEINWPYDYSERIIGHMTEDEQKIRRKIRLEYSSAELSDGFLGLILTTG